MDLKIEQKIISWLQAGLLTCLVVYAAYLSAQLTWFVFESKTVAPLMLSQASTVAEKKTNAYSSQLSRFHLFGEAGRVVSKQNNEPKVAPKTRLRLILKGVFTAEQGGTSGAIVEEIGKSADYYSLGTTLPGNAVLEEVYNDRILLRRNGKLETLSFVEKKSIGGSIVAKSRSSVSRRKEARVRSPEQFINEATREIASNPERALKSVGLAPSSGGGYVYQGGNPMLSGLNLQKGDVIRSVNGHPLGDIKKDKDLMKGLYEQGSLEVEVVRDGASFFINYPLR